jgi:hypothetical protein
LDWMLYGMMAVLAAAAAAGCLAFFLWRRRSGTAGEPGAAPKGPARGDGPAGGQQSPQAAVPPRKHIPPRIVSASGPPIPRPRALDAEPRPELPGMPPRVAREASEEEEEEGDMEDMAREAIDSTKMMVETLLAAGKDVSAALRQLSAAEEYLEQGKPAEALKYAGKAMDVAESLEAEQDRCPKCKAETKPRWLLCPRCGQPLR